MVYACIDKYKDITNTQGVPLEGDDFLGGVFINKENLLKSTGLILVGDSFPLLFERNSNSPGQLKATPELEEIIQKQAEAALISSQTTEQEINQRIADLGNKVKVLGTVLQLNTLWNNRNDSNKDTIPFKTYLEGVLGDNAKLTSLVTQAGLEKCLEPTPIVNQITDIFIEDILANLGEEFRKKVDGFDADADNVDRFKVEIVECKNKIDEEGKRKIANDERINALICVITPPKVTKKNKGVVDRAEAFRQEYLKQALNAAPSKGQATISPFTFLPVSSSVMVFSNKGGEVGLDLNNFVYSTEEAQALSEKARADQLTISTEQLLVESRQTTFTVVSTQTENGIERETHILFTFFEDGEYIMQIDVSQEYISSTLDECLFKFIRPLHSAFITYRSVMYKSFEAKKWGGVNENVAYASPMRLIQETRVFFKQLLFGENKRDVVNAGSNLMFSSLWEESTGSTNPNRLLGCSAYNSQLEVRDDFNNRADGRSVFLDLENALNSEVVLSEHPRVVLVPCYERGPILQTKGELVFRRLVNNSSSSLN